MNHKFSKNSRYYTIGIYTLFFILLATIIVKLVWNWDATSSLLSSLLDVVYPFLIGLLIAYLINPLAKLISKKLLKNVFKMKSRGARKLISVLLSYIIVITAIVTAMLYIVPQIGESLAQLSGFIESAQSGYTSIMNKLKELNEQYPEWKLDGIIEMINGIPALITDFVKTTAPKLLPTLYSTSMSLISGVVNMLISIMVSAYMLLDKPKLINNSKRVVYSLLNAEKADRFLDTLKECNKIFGNFIIGKMIDSIIIGILCWLILTIIGIPYALMISVIVGVTNMIPYFGPFIGAIPGILLLLIVDFKYALIFTIVIIALQQFDGLYLGPKILGESTGLRPIWIIFAITVGGSIAGVAGMFLGVPLVAVIAYLLDRILDRRLERRHVIFDVNSDTGIIKRRREKTDENQATDVLFSAADNVEKDSTVENHSNLENISNTEKANTTEK